MRVNAQVPMVLVAVKAVTAVKALTVFTCVCLCLYAFVGWHW